MCISLPSSGVPVHVFRDLDNCYHLVTHWYAAFCLSCVQLSRVKCPYNTSPGTYIGSALAAPVTRTIPYEATSADMIVCLCSAVPPRRVSVRKEPPHGAWPEAAARLGKGGPVLRAHHGASLCFVCWESSVGCGSQGCTIARLKAYRSLLSGLAVLVTREVVCEHVSLKQPSRSPACGTLPQSSRAPHCT